MNKLTKRVTILSNAGDSNLPEAAQVAVAAAVAAATLEEIL